MRGWATNILQNYSGTILWEPYGTTNLQILTQSEAVRTSSGNQYEVAIQAEGDGLSYAWYVKNVGEDFYVKSSFTGPVYSVFLTEMFRDQQVWCVVKDQYGNYLVSDSVLLQQNSARIVPIFS